MWPMSEAAKPPVLQMYILTAALLPLIIQAWAAAVQYERRWSRKGPRPSR